MSDSKSPFCVRVRGCISELIGTVCACLCARAIEVETGDDEEKKRRQVIEQLFLIECAAAYLDDAFNVCSARGSIVTRFATKKLVHKISCACVQGRLENGKGKTLNEASASWLAFQINAR